MELIIYIKMDLALNNQQRLICHKTQPTNLNNYILAFSMSTYKQINFFFMQASSLFYDLRSSFCIFFFVRNKNSLSFQTFHCILSFY